MSLFSLTIENFQSHEKTRLKLHQGINALVGDSDCGKSAVMRALLWCITNAPQGVAHVSNWAKNKKGDIKERCEVCVSASGGVVTRTRSKDENGYTLDDGGSDARKFSALRTDVPAEVADALNIGPVNIQRQLDPPFLISATPGEAARYINSLVDLQVIDEALSIVNGMNRDTANELKFSQAAQEKRQAEFDALDWVETLQELARQAEDLEHRRDELHAKASDMIVDLKAWESASRRAAMLEADRMEIANRLDQVDRISDRLDRAIAAHNRVSQSYSEYGAEKKRSAGLEAVEHASGLLDRAAQLEAQVAHKTDQLDALVGALEDYDAAARYLLIDADRLEDLLGVLNRTGAAIVEGRRVLEDNGLKEYDRAAPVAALDLGAVEGKLSRLNRIRSTLQGCRDDLEQKRADLRIFGTNRGLLEGADKRLQEALRALDGQICPCCGRPMHACEM